MFIKTDKIKVGREDGVWYIKGGNVTCWCNTLEEALAHIA